jgi:hypothetical protein
VKSMDEKEILDRLNRLDEGMKVIQELLEDMLSDPEVAAALQRLKGTRTDDPAESARPFTDRLRRDEKEPPFPG